MNKLALSDRAGLPDALRVLLADYPRAGWENDPQFDGLVRFWLDRHLMFRRLLAEINSQTEAMLDRKIDLDQFAPRLSRLGGMLVDQLHGHHTIEDNHYFPRLAGLEPKLERGFAILDQDHHALDHDLAGFVAAANAVLGPQAKGAKPRDTVGQFHKELSQLAKLLDRHLIDEEELIVPVILKHGPAGLS